MDSLETHNFGKQVADIITKQSGKTAKVQRFSEDEFDLYLDGEEYAGGSYYINKGKLILASVTPQKELGSIDDLSEIETNLKDYN
jgi:aspartyl-tRNA synthetase